MNGRIVFVTQAYDRSDPLLGVVGDWVGELARRFDGVDVIAQRAPGVASWRLRDRDRVGVRVATMGKERGAGRVGQFVAMQASLAQALSEALHRGTRGWGGVGGARAVFVHMVPRYAVLAAPLARIFRVPIILWYAHGNVDRALRMAVPLVHRILTPTRDSFPIDGARDPRVRARLACIGHGIDTARYSPDDLPDPVPGLVVTAGRLSPVKRHEVVMRELAAITPDRWSLRVVGAPLHDADAVYRVRLAAEAHSLGVAHRVTLVGAVPFDRMATEYRAAWVLAHTSRTGSLDKVVLEAAACGVPVVSTAPSSRAILGPFGDELLASDDREFGERLRAVLGWSATKRDDVGKALRAAVIAGHGLDHWADRVADVVGGL